jgi:drug/metabolite transporter (DMT)-like permease
MDRHLAKEELSPIVLSSGQLSSGVLLLVPLASLNATADILRTDALVAVAVLGFLGTGLAYVLNYRIIRTDGAVAASAVTYLLPVVATVLGYLILGEKLSPLMVVGMVFVLSGVMLTRRHSS